MDHEAKLVGPQVTQELSDELKTIGVKTVSNPDLELVRTSNDLKQIKPEGEAVFHQEMSGRGETRKTDVSHATPPQKEASFWKRVTGWGNSTAEWNVQTHVKEERKLKHAA